MGKFSTYRYLELKDDTIAPPHINVRSRAVKHPRKLKKVFIFLTVLALCITYFLAKQTHRKRWGLFAGDSQWLDGFAKSLGYEIVYHHAVIIDAGSSGSRVLAYKFRVPFTVFGQGNLDLVYEFFEQSKPGLSSYADDPEKGAETIVALIKKAEFMTPPHKRKSTPLIVRATAGLRLLPADKAQNLIDHVAKAINKLGYDVGPDGVQIMDGSDEGIFIWYTINLLHKQIEDGSMAALDLGGGSTQITYQLSDKDKSSYTASDQYVVPAGNNNITLYTHSYLHLGLLAARYGVFRSESPDNSTHELSSVCVDPIIQREPWTYANKQYFVSGSPRAAGTSARSTLARCRAVVKKYVFATLDSRTHPPPGAVAAMSYFYDIAADAGIIDVMSGGTVLVEAYVSAATDACSSANVDQPWACIDLVYALTLLQDAYKMPNDKPVSLFKKVNGHEVSWALGLAYTTVMNRIAIKP